MILPIYYSHSAYRKAALWFDFNEEAVGHFSLFQVDRREAYSRAVTRGTIQHEIFEGRHAVILGEDSELVLRINCRSVAGRLEDSVPYGLAVSLEVSEETNIPIYEEIRARIRPVVGIQLQPEAGAST